MVRIGKQPPRYKFILNPYVDARFTKCPKCDGKMGQRKLPLLIHVEPANPVALNKTCRYCVRCDLLIAHRDEIIAHLTALSGGRKTTWGENDFLIIGTLDRKDWKRGLKTPLSIPEMREGVHDFKQVLTIQVTGGWVRDEKPH
jgi:hypothetical protein